MKIIVIFFVYGLLFLSLTSNAEIASPLSQDQQDVIKFIQKLYSIPTDTYLFSEFNNKFQPKKHCQFMEGFIVKESLFKRAQGHCFVPIRYPTISDEDVTLSSDYPIPKIQIPVVKGNLAEVLVLFKKPDTGRVRYYLKKTQQGWRIYKARSDERAYVPENNTDPEIDEIPFTDFPPSAVDRELANHPK
jgi:hypothetical protein